MPAATVEQKRFASSYGLMDHFENYASRMGLTSNTIQRELTKGLARDIWNKCGQSYYTAEAYYCPTKSYMIGNFSSDYTITGKVTTHYHANISIPASYLDNQIIKLSDITYTFTTNAVSSERISTVGTMPYTYTISYDVYFPYGYTYYSAGFIASPRFYSVNYSVLNTFGTTDVVAINDVSVTEKKYWLKSHFLTNGTTSILKCADASNPTIYATYIVTFSPVNVSSVSSLTNVPTYVDILNSNAGNISLFLYGNAGSSKVTPIPKKIQIKAYNPITSDLVYTDTISSTTGTVPSQYLFNRTTSWTNGHPGNIKVTASYLISDITTSFYRKYNNFNVSYYNINAYVTNYDNSLRQTAPKKVYFIKDISINDNVGEITGPDNFAHKNSIILNQLNSLSIKITPWDVYFKKIQLILTKGGSGGNVALSSDPFFSCTRYEENNTSYLVIGINFIPVSNYVGQGTATVRITKYNDTTISRITNVSFVGAVYDYINVTAHGENQTTFEESGIETQDHSLMNGLYFLFYNNAENFVAPTMYDSGLLFKLRIKYYTVDSDATWITHVDYFGVYYRKVGAGSNRRKYKLIILFDHSSDEDYGDGNSSFDLFQHNDVYDKIKFSEDVIVQSVLLTYGGVNLESTTWDFEDPNQGPFYLLLNNIDIYNPETPQLWYALDYYISFDKYTLNDGSDDVEFISGMTMSVNVHN